MRIRRRKPRRLLSAAQLKSYIMERIIRYEGFEHVDSDLCATVKGGSIWGKIIRFFSKNMDQFLLGFIEGWTGQEIIGSLSE